MHDCGDHHEHKHESGITADCGCNHHHEHKDEFINISEHEGAFVCSAEMHVHNDFYDVEKIVISEMETLSNYIIDGGGYIGHMKSFIKSGESWAQISITKGKARVNESEKKEGRCILIQFAAIVFNVESQYLLHGVNILFGQLKPFEHEPH